MSKMIGRRGFFQRGAALATAGLALHTRNDTAAALQGAPAAPEDSGAYKVKWYEFTEHPDSDTCWSLSVGPDGRIYAAACAESVPGGVVKVVRYNDVKDGLDYLLSVDEKVDDPADSGRATQCKIHYSFAPSLHDGILYMATHLSGPPLINQRTRLGDPGTTRNVASEAAPCWLSIPRPTRLSGGRR